ncbi:MAG TPA: DUF2808 domain-containing protein [Crinalium sp.]
MRTSALFATTLAVVLGVGGTGFHQIAQAVQLSDGKVYFVQPPRLLAASTTRTQTSQSGSTYYFTLSVPETAGEPLQRIAIAQQNGGNSFRNVEYELDNTRAFVGTRGDRGAAIPVRETTYDSETETVSVVFDQPVPPGTTVTIGLRPDRNPDLDGLYLFGVTAFPAGESAYGQFLGYGRLEFYSPDHDFFFPR